MTDKKHLDNILDFFSSFNNWEESDFLFEKISSFFTEKYSAEALLVFSLPKGVDIGEKKIRVVWNRESFNAKEEEICFKFIEDPKSRDDIINFSFSQVVEQREYHLFHIGDDDLQSYVACFRLPLGLVSPEVLKAFISFFKNTHNQIQRWKGLSRQSSLVHIDDVTGLYNQRKLHKDLIDLIRKYERSGENFALLFIDIDHFKSVNDNYGHLIGTKLLSDLGKVLRRVLRDTDLLYRYGGDEFVAIVPDASTNDARKIGDRVLSSVRDELFKVEESEEIFRISISVGIASFPRDAKNGKEVLELADRMMYRAKNRGRGCVCLAGDFYKK